MTGFVSLRGYALPFLQIEKSGRRLEYFDRGAVDLDSNPPIFLNYADHDAPSISSPVSLFADDYGVGFIASIREDVWRGIVSGLVRDVQFCSVETKDEEIEEIIADGERVSRILKARLTHITLCSCPVYAGTGVWPSEISGPMPPRLAALAEKWEAGRAKWLAGRRAKAGARPALPINRSVVRGPPDPMAAAMRHIPRNGVRNSPARTRAYAAFRMAGGLRATERD